MPSTAGPRQSVALDGSEALRLLGSVSLGRIVFTQHALPTIRPVNHLLDNGSIIIRTHEGSALTSHTRHSNASNGSDRPGGSEGSDGPGVVVAYEADDIDPATRLGWSVVVTGYARLVTDPRELARYRALLHPWVQQTMDYTVRIHPDLVTGIRLIAVDEPVAGPPAAE
ncbi:hypothetical protein GCM10010365_25970 [Streptomyces poonensis]|uniref:Pyridoxamine 5'-phosphate oxidase family protein n=1 Tax=Streptomyces poonensis TaxID=68255 RepID=A0A918UGS7_9ACTN|nr:hypothetical protein GCM10010365_25970 [Streptomyces poonensis]GLJ92561.1 hypothetical protein GCM10017589_51710 [Streptomyces poonensis]